MSNELDPVVGNWYRHADKGQTFRVVEVNDDEDTITVQHFDGDLEEIDEDAWFEMDLELAEEPEDWTGPVDDVETDDLGYTETGMTEPDWKAPLQESRPSKEQWEDEDDEDEKDEWGEGESEEDLYGSEP
jgi:hypothetical protein